MVVLIGITMACFVGVQGAVQQNAAAAPLASATGFSFPYAGTPRYEKYAPTPLTQPGDLNGALGQDAADRIARGLGLDKSKTFTARQYALFVSGQGVPVPDPYNCPKLVDQSVRILTNTVGNPLFATVDGQLIASVLGSYGLMVNEEGLLQSPANTNAPTRQINNCLAPGGYLAQWTRANGASRSLAMLYRSAYPSEVAFGFAAQSRSGAAQLVPNRKGANTTVVGMSMAPALWIVNFCLIYTLNPKLAANMPGRWAPIPAPVAQAIASSQTGQVPFSEFASYFEGSWYPVR